MNSTLGLSAFSLFRIVSIYWSFYCAGHVATSVDRTLQHRQRNGLVIEQIGQDSIFAATC